MSYFVIMHVEPPAGCKKRLSFYYWSEYKKLNMKSLFTCFHFHFAYVWHVTKQFGSGRHLLVTQQHSWRLQDSQWTSTKFCKPCKIRACCSFQVMLSLPNGPPSPWQYSVQAKDLTNNQEEHVGSFLVSYFGPAWHSAWLACAHPMWPQSFPGNLKFSG